MRFADIPGHSDVKQRLTAMVDQGHIPHAILLEGPEGSAKFAIARALAQYIHCENRHNGDSCGMCPACRQSENFRHIDTIYSYPVVKPAGKEAISADYLDDFQEFVNEHPWNPFDEWLKQLGDPNTKPMIYVHEAVEILRRANYTAQSSQYKTILMWLPERMNEDTSNKLLKVIEEPYDDTVFIFASDEPGKILPTIYSRVQRVKVAPYSAGELSEWLQRVNGLGAQAAADVATLADGSINKALKFLKTDSARQRYFEDFVALMRLAYQRNIAALKKWSNDRAELTRERQLNFLVFCASMIRENFIYNLNRPAFIRMTAQEKEFSSRFARFITEKNAAELANLFDDARVDIAQNANSKIVFFDVAVRTFMLLRR